MGRNSLLPLQTVTEAEKSGRCVGGFEKVEFVISEMVRSDLKGWGGRGSVYKRIQEEGYFLRWNVTFSTKYLCVDEWMSE